MSEKQARIKRKNDVTEEPVKKKKGSALLNWITALLVIVFLGLGGYALKDNIKALLPEKPEKETTVADLAKERDMTVDEFLEEFGLADAELDKDSTEAAVMSKLTVANYAKYSDKTVEELLDEFEITGATEDMLWQEAYELMPMGKYAETMGTTFEELKEQLGLPEEITESMTISEATKIVTEKQAQEEAEEEETAEDAAE